MATNDDYKIEPLLLGPELSVYYNSAISHDRRIHMVLFARDPQCRLKHRWKEFLDSFQPRIGQTRLSSTTQESLYVFVASAKVVEGKW